MKQISFGVLSKTSGMMTEIQHIFSTQVARLFLIILMVISFTLAIQFSTASVSNIDIDSPSEVYLNEEFEVNLNIQPEGEYDVKIFTHNSTDEKIIQSEITSLVKNVGSWASSWNYLSSYLFPSTQSFQIKVVSGPKEQILCTRIREAGKSSFTESCKNVTVIEKENYDNKILLNPKIENMQYLSFEQRKRNFIAYSFLSLLILSAIIYILRRLQH